ncbi:MAG: hypothetical protein GF332_04675 [Candidatus Moranbacteria bacterium]|nr:hypothetical protein [Candidatus Moranbacteria bacterium]
MIIDAKNKNLFSGSKLISEPVLDLIKKDLTTNHVVFIGTIQKGSSTSIICRDCGYVPICPDCDRSYFLLNQTTLKCPVCSKTQPYPNTCPKCSSSVIKSIGLGIDRLENHLKPLFPDLPVLKATANQKSTKNANTLSQICQLKKGLVVSDLLSLKIARFNLNTGSIFLINIDKLFFYPDYRINEIIYQNINSLLSKNYSIHIQTKFSSNPILAKALADDYQGFFHKEIKLRREKKLPPFTRLLKLSSKDASQSKAQKKLQKLIALPEFKTNSFQLFTGIYPGYPEKINAQFIFHLLLGFQKTWVKNQLDQPAILKFCRTNKIAIDVDPVSLI